MKTKLLLCFLFLILGHSNCYASFPVKRTTASEKIQNGTTEETLTPMAVTAAKNKWVGTALLVFLGWPFAAHRWYYQRETLYNILFIITFAGFGIWAIVDLINILSDNW
jgi:hypothetical protein